MSKWNTAGELMSEITRLQGRIHLFELVVDERDAHIAELQETIETQREHIQAQRDYIAAYAGENNEHKQHTKPKKI